MFADLAVCYSNMHTVSETNWTIRHMINWISTINYIYKLKIYNQSKRIKQFQSRYSATVYNMD